MVGVLIVKGMIFSGLLFYTFKIPIAAFTFLLFRISKDKLLSFTWFTFIYERILNFFIWIKSLDICKKNIKIVYKINQDISLIWKKLKKNFPNRGGFLQQLKSVYHKLYNR